MQLSSYKKHRFLGAIGWSGLIVVIAIIVFPAAIVPKFGTYGIEINTIAIMQRMVSALLTSSMAALGALLATRFFKPVTTKELFLTTGFAFLGGLIGIVIVLIPFVGLYWIIFAMAVGMIWLILFFYVMNLGLVVSVSGPDALRKMRRSIKIISIVLGIPLIMICSGLGGMGLFTLIFGWYEVSIWPAVAILLQPEGEVAA